MEILVSILVFPAILAGVMLLAIVACGVGPLDGPPAWSRLLKKGVLYAILLTFLLLIYTFCLSAALETSYLFFVAIFTALFGYTSFLIPKSVIGLFGSRMQWFARSIAAFGCAFVLLTFSALLIRELPLSAAIPEPALLLITVISFSVFAVSRLIRARSLDPSPVSGSLTWSNHLDKGQRDSRT